MASERPIFDPARMAAQEEPTLAARSMTVSQLNALVKRVLGNGLPATIHLAGQISNYTRPSSGHLYFTLKDENAEVRAVMWKTAAASVKFKIEDGMEVVATGSVDVYEPRGQYQFYVRKLEPKGVGNLELAFRQLYERLSREGLFDKDRKKPIPKYPRRIGVVTSPTGAAIHDILQTLQRRFACVEVLLYPVRVQGEGAAGEIASAIRHLNEQAEALGGIDVMIVGRGGGSLEDLWAFNEEIVARAIYDSSIPVISGVGHEVDTTITDLVADLRAPTPTAAAELAVPRRSDVRESLAMCESRLRGLFGHHLELARSRLDSVGRAELFRNPQDLVNRAEQRLDDAANRLGHAIGRQLSQAHRQVDSLQLRLAGVRPAVVIRDRQAVLASAEHRLRAAVQKRWRQMERQIDSAGRRLLRASPVGEVAAYKERLRNCGPRLDRGLNNRLGLLGASIESLAKRLEATGYRQTLARGFSVTWNERRERIVTRPGQVNTGQIIVTETSGGEFKSRVEEE